MGSNEIRAFADAPASKPGGVLLFQRLSVSTIGAVRFHGRVRDGIGWVTDAMATKLWGRRDDKKLDLEIDDHLLMSPHQTGPNLSLMVGFSSANRAIRTG